MHVATKALMAVLGVVLMGAQSEPVTIKVVLAPVVWDSNANHTIVDADCDREIHLTNPGKVTVTVPANLPSICYVAFEQDGGQITVVPASGVTPVSAFKWTHSYGLGSIIVITAFNGQNGKPMFNLVGQGAP